MDDVIARIDAQRRRIEGIQRSVSQMEITGRAAGGDVTATLKGTGQFTSITIDPAAMRRHDADTVAASVLEAVNDGLRRLAEVQRTKFEPIIAEARG